MTAVLSVLVLGFVAFVVGMQVLVYFRAKAMEGKTLPALPGEIGRKLTASKHALVYFFSPSCAACRALTPRFTALGKKNKSVFVVNVFDHLEVARGLNVMGTPSVVEIAEGKIVGYHVGAVPPEVIARFEPA